MAKMDSESLKNNLDNVARSYLWEVSFTNPIGGGDSDVLELRCQTTEIPGRSCGRIHVPFKGTAGVEFAGKIQMSHEWPCSFIEGTDGKVFDALHAWQESITAARSGIGSLDLSIKSDIYLRLLTQANVVYKNIKLVGCFLMNVDSVPLTYESEKEIVYGARFSYDFWEPRT